MSTVEDICDNLAALDLVEAPLPQLFEAALRLQEEADSLDLRTLRAQDAFSKVWSRP